jgi:hypothetical protein
MFPALRIEEDERSFEEAHPFSGSVEVAELTR